MGMLSMLSSVGKGRGGLPSRGIQGKRGLIGGIIAEGNSCVRLSASRDGTGRTSIDNGRWVCAVISWSGTVETAGTVGGGSSVVPLSAGGEVFRSGGTSCV